ncbi:hypothetical protein D3C80_1253130 [compost metagenome]
MVVGIDHGLVVHRRVDGGNGDVLQTHGLVEKFQQGHTAVGGAGGVGHQFLGAAQAVLVDSVDDGGIDVRLAAHGLGEQHPRRAGSEEALGVLAMGVLAGALQHQVHAQGGPVDAFRLGMAQHLHAIAIDMQAIAVHPHFAGKSAVGGVEAGQVFDAGLVGQVVQRDDLEARPVTALVERTQHAAADAAVAVEGDFEGAIGHGQVSDWNPLPVGTGSQADSRMGGAQRYPCGNSMGIAGSTHPTQSSSNSSAVATILSTVKPKCSNSAAAGADSPKLVIPMTRPSRPTYLNQKSAWAASMAMRAPTCTGSTACL